MAVTLLLFATCVAATAAPGLSVAQQDRLSQAYVAIQVHRMQAQGHAARIEDLFSIDDAGNGQPAGERTLPDFDALQARWAKFRARKAAGETSLQDDQTAAWLAAVEGLLNLSDAAGTEPLLDSLRQHLAARDAAATLVREADDAMLDRVTPERLEQLAARLDDDRRSRRAVRIAIEGHRVMYLENMRFAFGHGVAAMRSVQTLTGFGPPTQLVHRDEWIAENMRFVQSLRHRPGDDLVAGIGLGVATPGVRHDMIAAADWITEVSRTFDAAGNAAAFNDAVPIEPSLALFVAANQARDEGRDWSARLLNGRGMLVSVADYDPRSSVTRYFTTRDNSRAAANAIRRDR